MLPGGLKVLLAVEPVDMRRSIDGLSDYVTTVLQHDPKVDRASFVFANARRDRAKVLWRDATGWCLLYKRLDKNVVALPTSIPAGAVGVDRPARSVAAAGWSRSCAARDGEGRRHPSKKEGARVDQDAKLRPSRIDGVC